MLHFQRDVVLEIFEEIHMFRIVEVAFSDGEVIVGFPEVVGEMDVLDERPHLFDGLVEFPVQPRVADVQAKRQSRGVHRVFDPYQIVHALIDQFLFEADVFEA